MGTKTKTVSKDFTTVSSSSGSITLDLSLGDRFKTTLTENITSVTFSNPPTNGEVLEFTWEVVQDVTGGWDITFPSAGSTQVFIGTGQAVDLTIANSAIYRFYSSINETPWIWNGETQFADLPKALGGTTTTSGAYTIHTFTSNGNFVVNEDLTVDYMLVGGGGGGGGLRGGGGGGGGAYIYDTGVSMPLSTGTFAAVIGAGGAGANSPVGQGSNGSDTTFDGLTADGGGGGGSGGSGSGSSGNSATTQGLNGGSGGGGGAGCHNTAQPTTLTGGTATADQLATPVEFGNDGGDGIQVDSTDLAATGGGGGAGAVGGDGEDQSGLPFDCGHGGIGKQNPIDSKFYGAGGGGGAYLVAGFTPGNGGSSVGGGGGVSATVGTKAVDNSGSGGGGGGGQTATGAYQSYPTEQINANYGNHGAAGSVVIRYLT